MTNRDGSEQPWDSPEYARIVDARYLQGELSVRFGDGAEARIDVARMPRVLERGPVWAAMTFDEFEIVVPTREEPFEIPWLPIRSLTDTAFHAHLKEQERKSTRRSGQVVGALRREQGLTVAVLAERAGLSPAALLSIERGDHDGHLGDLRRVLTAMGRDWRDLVEFEIEEPQPSGARSA